MLEPLVVAGSAIGRCAVVSVAVNAVAHLERLNLTDLNHASHVAVAGRTYGGRQYAVSLGEKLDMRFVNKMYVVGHSMNPDPVNRFASLAKCPKLFDFGVAISDGLMAG